VTRVVVAAEGGGSPVWIDEPVHGATIDPESLGLSVDLARSLMDWAAQHDRALRSDADFKWDESEGPEQTWTDAGRMLAGRVQQALGPDYEVTFGPDNDWRPRLY